MSFGRFCGIVKSPLRLLQRKQAFLTGLVHEFNFERCVGNLLVLLQRCVAGRVQQQIDVGHLFVVGTRLCLELKLILFQYLLARVFVERWQLLLLELVQKQI